MHVAHFVNGTPNPFALNGVRKSVYDLSSAQAALGARVEVFALGGRHPTRIPGVHVRTFAPSTLPVVPPRALFESIRSSGADVVHLHSPYAPTNAAVAYSARRSGIPYVVTPHGALSPGEIRERWPLKLPYKYMIERALLNGAAFVHCLSPNERLREYGVTSPIVTIPNGIDLDSLPAREMPEDSLRRRHPEIGDRTIVLYMGRFDPRQKGLDALVRAAAADIGGIALVLMGPDWRGGRRRLERLAQRMARIPLILAQPVQGPKKFSTLASADAFIHPSRWEGVANAVLEAAAVGLPCLLTAAADPVNRLKTAGGAIRIESEPDSIAEALGRVAAMTSTQLRQMGSRARQVVAEHYRLADTARLLLDAYGAHTLGQSGTPARHGLPES